MKNSDLDDRNWERTRALLKEHLPPQHLKHPDFVNARVMEELRREERTVGRVMSLPRLVWAGVGLLLIAAGISLTALPGGLGGGDDEAFVSRVIETRTGVPHMTVTAFQVPDGRGVVLWLEGMEFISGNERVQ